MSRDRRMTRAGQPVPYTCKNRKFQTDTSRGCARGRGRVKGSALPFSLVAFGGKSLWLEHVREPASPASSDLYWLMWYDDERDGVPLIPMSGVLPHECLTEVAKKLLQAWKEAGSRPRRPAKKRSRKPPT